MLRRYNQLQDESCSAVQLLTRAWACVDKESTGDRLKLRRGTTTPAEGLVPEALSSAMLCSDRTTAAVELSEAHGVPVAQLQQHPETNLASTSDHPSC